MIHLSFVLFTVQLTLEKVLSVPTVSTPSTHTSSHTSQSSTRSVPLKQLNGRPPVAHKLLNSDIKQSAACLRLYVVLHSSDKQELHTASFAWVGKLLSCFPL